MCVRLGIGAKRSRLWSMPAGMANICRADLKSVRAPRIGTSLMPTQLIYQISSANGYLSLYFLCKIFEFSGITGIVALKWAQVCPT